MTRWSWLLVLVASIAHAQAPDVPPNETPLERDHRYELRARLDPATHEVHGEGRITWRNESRVPVGELVFHRYLEAFRHERTVFMRESGQQLRGVRFRGGGGLDVSALALETPGGSVDLLASTDDDPDADDRSCAAVSRALAWRAHHPERALCGEAAPRVRAEAATTAIHVVAQWFPKLARSEMTHLGELPYHGFGEFYADFATYDLTVEVPRGWDAGRDRRRAPAGGGRRPSVPASSKTACTTPSSSPRPGSNQPARSRTRRRTSTFRVLLVHPPGFGSAARRHLEVTSRASRTSAKVYGAYPYDQLTVVVPPRVPTARPDGVPDAFSSPRGLGFTCRDCPSRCRTRSRA
ncbi:MAG: hypothetical protein R3B99_34520 [Polyangiales bacterium]